MHGRFSFRCKPHLDELHRELYKNRVLLVTLGIKKQIAIPDTI